MKILTVGVIAGSLLLAGRAVAGEPPLRQERVPGGTLELNWTAAFGGPNLVPSVLNSGDAGYSNPSGDHSVGVLFNTPPDQGGIGEAVTETGGVADYRWEADIFTGAGDSRRGLVVRADTTNGFQSGYQFVIQAGLLQLNFRKLINGAPTTLGTWFTTSTPGGFPAANSWHRMAVVAQGSNFRCFWDGHELTTTPIVDTTLGSGWVGVYNFRFDIGGIPVLFDDLTLTRLDQPTPVTITSWSAIKGRVVGS